MVLPKVFSYLPISKLHSTLADANLLALNDVAISYVQINSLWKKWNVVSKWASKHLWDGAFYFAVDGA